MTFPGAGANVYRNEAGEPTGWDYPVYDEPDYDPYADLADADYYGDWDEGEDGPDDLLDDMTEDEWFAQYWENDEPEAPTEVIFMPVAAYDGPLEVWDPEEGSWP